MDVKVIAGKLGNFREVRRFFARAQKNKQTNSALTSKLHSSVDFVLATGAKKRSLRPPRSSEYFGPTTASCIALIFFLPETIHFKRLSF